MGLLGGEMMWKLVRMLAGRRTALTAEQLEDLRAWLEARGVRSACDDTPRQTKSWAARAGLDTPELGRWLARLGGVCDCEILYNVCGAEPDAAARRE